jgi:hypothetical protein
VDVVDELELLDDDELELLDDGELELLDDGELEDDVVAAADPLAGGK